MLLSGSVRLAAQDVKLGLDVSPIVPADTHTLYIPITGEQRVEWFTNSTFGWESLLVAGPWTSAWGTAIDSPHEYGPHWDGFAKRYAVRLAQVTVNNGINTGVGSFLGEDPRYFRTIDQPFKQRVLNVLDLTFRAYRSDGQRHVAYARLSADVASNFIANSWLPPSESDWQSATWRSLTGIGSIAAGNAIQEFLPDLLRLIRHKHAYSH